MGKTARWTVVAIAAVTVAGATVAAIGVGGRGTQPTATQAPRTAEVARTTLVDYKDLPGQLGFGEVVPLRYVPPLNPATEDGGAQNGGAQNGGAQNGGAQNGGAQDGGAQDGEGQPGDGGQPDGEPPNDEQGLITWLPRTGSTVNRGDPLFRVDNRPVLLLLGALPLYRSLRPGVKGPDVRQLEHNLRALGYSGFTVDDSFTTATAGGVKRWQRERGLAQTGVVAPGQIVYADRPVRVAEHLLRVGDRADGEVLGLTGTGAVVTMRVPASQRRYVDAGTRVSIMLPDSATVDGSVKVVDSAPAEPDAGQDPTEPAVTVTIDVADPTAMAGQQGAVTVRFVAEERRDVLTVPVVALVALAEGGYGVQVVEGSATRYVAIETGMFARGRVEVTAGELRPGMRVVVPA